MTKGQRQVKEFMEFFGQECPEKPVAPSVEIATLRAALILEEAIETIVKGLGLAVHVSTPTVSEYGEEPWQRVVSFKDVKEVKFSFSKFKEPDLKELADGLADLGYVGDLGTAVAAGIDLEPVQDEVHASNMSKAWRKKDLDKVPEGHTIERFKHTDLFRVKRADGKIIKSPSYKEAAIQQIIDSQINPQPEPEEDILPDCETCPNCGQSTYSPEYGYCNECGVQTH